MSSDKSTQNLSQMFGLLFPRAHIAEVIEFLGKDTGIAFMELFAGTTIKFPTRDELESMLQRHAMYSEYLSDNTVKISNLAKYYNIPRRTAYWVIHEMDRPYSGERRDMKTIKKERDNGF